jgi:hypothetical protein
MNFQVSRFVILLTPVFPIQTLHYCSYCTILKNSLSNLLGFYQYHLQIFEELDIPESTKYGTVTPVLKPNKDKIYPENYRGITVTNTFSTVIEGILKELYLYIKVFVHIP